MRPITYLSCATPARRTLLAVVLLLALEMFSRERGVTAAPASAAQPVTKVSAPQSFYGSPFAKHPNAATLAALGRGLFNDSALSSSGVLACASCHDPAFAYGPPNGRSVQLGGPGMSRPGVRAVPTLAYHQDVPPFTEHFSETDGDDSVDQGPVGGRAWDGRASSAHDQAGLPLLSAFEMDNADIVAVVDRLKRSSNAAGFRAAFGEKILDDVPLAWNGLRLALEVFQQSPADFYPYTSKYDAYLKREVTLSEAEQRGLAAFNDPVRGNCASCHPSAIKRGAFPQFTDNGFVALGVPRNARIPANRRRDYFDLGLCGPFRTDLKDNAAYCGLFKTPTLRNVALRRTFFHNGAFATLEDAVKFYVNRDLHPEKIYPRGEDRRVRKFDDLPQNYRGNVNMDAPFGDLQGRPALSNSEIADVVAFLRTLTDGFVPPRSTHSSARGGNATHASARP